MVTFRSTWSGDAALLFVICNGSTLHSLCIALFHPPLFFDFELKHFFASFGHTIRQDSRDMLMMTKRTTTTTNDERRWWSVGRSCCSFPWVDRVSRRKGQVSWEMYLLLARVPSSTMIYHRSWGMQLRQTLMMMPMTTTILDRRTHPDDAATVNKSMLKLTAKCDSLLTILLSHQDFCQRWSFFCNDGRMRSLGKKK